jgi:phosphatidylserine/phosphatidylglycerophosphate/cardiolipin synthase-like enzyme
MRAFAELSVPSLMLLAEALNEGRLTSNLEEKVLRLCFPAGDTDKLNAELSEYFKAGFSPEQLARLLSLLADERRTQQSVRDRVSWVWSGPADAFTSGRDTAVVVQELFAAAKQSVLLLTYAIDRGEKARAIFEPLAKRMDAEPGLDVVLCVNIHPLDAAAESPTKTVAEFVKRFRAWWPGERLPSVYYDPHSLNQQGKERTSMHAKCLVIDNSIALISSANFTEAAHARNTEIGVLLRDPAIAQELADQVLRLVGLGTFARCI